MQVRLEGANNTQIGFSNGIAVVGVKDGITEVKIPEKFNDLDIVSVSSDIFNSTLKTLDISKRVTPVSYTHLRLSGSGRFYDIDGNFERGRLFP